MNSTQTSYLKEHIAQMEDPRLIMWVVSCHVDKPLLQKIPSSKYDLAIQAGAALTDVRICPINDYDADEMSISNRNQRYSECTAMDWIGRHIETPYIGITHYRRRFRLTDSQLSDYLDKGFDIITTNWFDLPEKIDENYKIAYYGHDWDLFIKLIEKHAPNDIPLAKELFSLAKIHPCNLNIFRKEIYEEYCEYVFPILDDFYKLSPIKTDRYQRRDVGFIAERLSSLFVEKKRRQKATIHMEDFYDLSSHNWLPEDTCNLSDFNAVYNVACSLYNQEQIMRAGNVVAGALKHGGYSNNNIRQLAELFGTASAERKVLEKTMFEYLPLKWRSDLVTLQKTYIALENLLRSIRAEETEEKKILLQQFVSMTGFSNLALERIIKRM